MTPRRKSAGSRSTRRTYRRRYYRARPRYKYVRATPANIERISSELAKELKDHLMLSEYNIGDDVVTTCTKEFVQLVIGDAKTMPDKDGLLRRILALRDNYEKFIASNILEKTDSFTDEKLLEYVVTRGREVCLRRLPELYSCARKFNREDLVMVLKSVWEEYGRPSVLACNNCGFRAVAPDLTCLVCGRTVDENYAREQLSFRENFGSFIKSASDSELREVLQSGFVVTDGYSVKPLSKRAEGDYVIELKPSELDEVRRELKSR